MSNRIGPPWRCGDCALWHRTNTEENAGRCECAIPAYVYAYDARGNDVSAHLNADDCSFFSRRPNTRRFTIPPLDGGSHMVRVDPSRGELWIDGHLHPLVETP